jgi:hypothetical protein
MQPAPSQPQIVGGPLGQFGNFNFNLGQVLPSRAVVPVATPTENRRRPASALASRGVVDRRRHAFVGSGMR